MTKRMSELPYHALPIPPGGVIQSEGPLTKREATEESILVNSDGEDVESIAACLILAPPSVYLNWFDS